MYAPFYLFISSEDLSLCYLAVPGAKGRVQIKMQLITSQILGVIFEELTQHYTNKYLS